MIFTFRFISDEEEDFVLDVNINHDQTFFQLHQAINEALQYDVNQLASFFTSNDHWEKMHEITLEDMGGDGLVKTMAATTIEDYFSKKGQRLLYVFDYFNERLLFGSVVRTIDAIPPVKLPSVSKIEGKIPPQTLQDETFDNMDMDPDDFDMDDLDFEDLPEDLDDFDPTNF